MQDGRLVWEEGGREDFLAETAKRASAETGTEVTPAQIEELLQAEHQKIEELLQAEHQKMQPMNRAQRRQADRDAKKLRRR